MDKPKVLLTFVGFHDPFHDGLVQGQAQIGPVLTVVGEMGIDRAFLFSTEKTAVRAAETKAEIEQRFQAKASVINLSLPDPTDYRAIIRGLRGHLPGIIAENRDAELFAAIDAGTPQMHVCWLMLTLGGELPARVLQATPPQFAGDPGKLVRLIDLSGPDFPAVRFAGGAPGSASQEVPELGEVMRELGIIGEHESILRAAKTAAAASRGSQPVLISGESGTGKELFAKLVWRLGPRSGGPFLAESLADKPPTLVESELFGHARGAFTGAISDKAGIFDQADGGVLFLDEITLLPKDIQNKLLRVLQDGRYRPVGSRQDKRSDFQLVTATNEDIKAAVREGRFKQDLYYRIRVVSIHLPPLRERWSDVQLLAFHFLDRMNKDCRQRKSFSPDAIQKLVHHRWPGNIRELENVVRCAHTLSRGPVISADDVSLEGSVETGHFQQAEPHPGFKMTNYLDRERKRLVDVAMEKSQGRQSQAARMLGITPQALSKYLRECDRR